MKKMISLILCLALVCCLFAGCAAKTADDTTTPADTSADTAQTETPAAETETPAADSESDERKSAADDRKAQKEFILFLSFDFMEHSFYAFFV